MHGKNLTTYESIFPDINITPFKPRRSIIKAVENENYQKLNLKRSQVHKQIPVETDTEKVFLGTVSSFLQNRLKYTGSQLNFSTCEQIGWLQSPQNADVLKLKISELIQMERCDSNFSYLVDEPSKLVRIECLKPGCKCVLKQEPALAMKIICGISLLNGKWSSNESCKIQTSEWLSEQSSFSNLTQPIRHNFNSLVSPKMHCKPIVKSKIPIIITSCSPIWFEMLQKSPNGSTDMIPSNGPPIIPWTSGKSLWKARPSVFLLCKLTKCVISMQHCSKVANEAALKTPICLDMDNFLNLYPGTVLRLLDCKMCHLSSSKINHLTSEFMLQCEVVGGDYLAKNPSTKKMNPKDALFWFANGPKLVYILLDDKSVSFYPIASAPQTQKLTTNNLLWPFKGAHSTISLLSNFQLPISVRPLIDFSLTDPTSSSETVLDKNTCLVFSSVYHGDLVFLEPIRDCSKYDNRNSFTTNSNRFFVVTAEMLSQHRFLVASPESVKQYSRELKIHADRVAHFLSATHPEIGLNYLLKYLEETTHCSSVGPANLNLTRTLGPSGDGSSVSISTISSIIAVSTLYLSEIEHNPNFLSSSVKNAFTDLKSSNLHTKYDEIDDIYQYVRTGKFSNKQFENRRKPNRLNAKQGIEDNNNHRVTSHLESSFASTNFKVKPINDLLTSQINKSLKCVPKMLKDRTQLMLPKCKYDVPPYPYFSPSNLKSKPYTSPPELPAKPVSSNLKKSNTSLAESGFYQHDESSVFHNNDHLLTNPPCEQVDQISFPRQNTPRHSISKNLQIHFTTSHLKTQSSKLVKFISPYEVTNDTLTSSGEVECNAARNDCLTCSNSYSRDERVSSGLAKKTFRTVDQIYPKVTNYPISQLTSYLANSITERTNSSPDTGLGGESIFGPSIIPPAKTFVRSNYQPVFKFCQNLPENYNRGHYQSIQVSNRRLV